MAAVLALFGLSALLLAEPASRRSRRPLRWGRRVLTLLFGPLADWSLDQSPARVAAGADATAGVCS